LQKVSKERRGSMELCMLFTLVKTSHDLGAIYCQQLHSLQ
jgi:hypothetical protein